MDEAIAGDLVYVQESTDCSRVDHELDVWKVLVDRLEPGRCWTGVDRRKRSGERRKMLPAGVPEQTRNNILGSSTQAQGVCVARSGAYVAVWCLNWMSELMPVRLLSRLAQFSESAPGWSPIH